MTFTDRNEHYRLNVRHGVLVATDKALPGDGPADLTLVLPRQALLMTTFTPFKLADLVKSGTVKADGDIEAFNRLVSWLDPFTSDFPVVTR